MLAAERCCALLFIVYLRWVSDWSLPKKGKVFAVLEAWQCRWWFWQYGFKWVCDRTWPLRALLPRNAAVCG